MLMTGEESRQLKKESRIKKRFAEMSAQRKYTTEYMLNRVGEEFYLSPRTIEAIVTGEYDRMRERRNGDFCDC